MFLDIGIGLLGAIVYATVTGHPLSVTLIVASVVFSLLPDIDFMVAVIQHRTVHTISHTHRELLHHPIIYILLGSVVTTLFGGISIGILFTAISITHFLHDSIGIGWGVPWFSPFSDRFYKFFSEKDGRFSWRLVVSWTPEEQREVERQAGDPNWLRNIYFHWHAIAIIEMVVFLIALGLLLFRLW